ncbi:hypothetical protein [Blastococcus xanthinilyticus]|uniref:Uncharacterized protein n=1 Tax=Blastococcus xanthinilyticus TaxID=1564164 RepID=A0A5S5CP97_9ACTN|nr:hypothetical protein [Blastococcus xanthinilyticus]TYP80687.1 hypothetical protein BD833_12810 [Blastococcus xanthinilyticus]
MQPSDDCPAGDHRTPDLGGSCACGMVTRIPAAPAPANADVRDVLARCLDDGVPGPVAAGTAQPGVEERVDRVLAAFADAGLVVSPELRLDSPA